MSVDVVDDEALDALYSKIEALISGDMPDELRTASLPFYRAQRRYRLSDNKDGPEGLSRMADVFGAYGDARQAMNDFEGGVLLASESEGAEAGDVHADAPDDADELAFSVVTTPSTLNLDAAPNGIELEVQLDQLRSHPRNVQLLPVSSDADAAKLAVDIEVNGLVHPLIIAGEDCASLPGTVLDGHRRHAAMLSKGISKARAIVRTGLSATDEEILIIRCAVASQLHRRLSEEDKFKLEERARELLRAQGHRHGRRSDLATAVAGNGSSTSADADDTPRATVVASNHSSGPRGRANAIVAASAGDALNAVREREKIFGSSVTTPVLKEALAAEKISRKKAASIVRIFEAEVGEQLDDEGAIAAARGRVDERVKAEIEAQTKLRSRKAMSSSSTRNQDAIAHADDAQATIASFTDTSVEMRDVVEFVWSDAGDAVVELLGHRVRVTRTADGGSLEVIGAT
ncbi:MAG: ParB N-terminal domain-containing protein [Polyangiales bacterium]